MTGFIEDPVVQQTTVEYLEHPFGGGSNVVLTSPPDPLVPS